MGKKGNGRIEKARAEIERLKARRRLDLIKILAALAAIMLILLGKPMLENAGIIEADNMVVNGAMWISAFILAIFAGSAGRDLSKCGRSIDEVRTLQPSPSAASNPKTAHSYLTGPQRASRLCGL